MTCRRSTCATSWSTASCRGPLRPGQDPSDTISPKGDFSQDINFASCTGLLPPPTLPASFVQHLQLSLTGKSSPVLGNRCAGRAFGDNIARGYITVDTVNNCTLRFPGDPGYFGRRHGDAPTRTSSGATTSTSTRRQNFADGDTLVHIEASRHQPRDLGRRPVHLLRPLRRPGRAADNREPLATNFAARYVNGGTVQRRHRPASSGATRRSTRRRSPARRHRPSGLVPAGPGRRS